MAALVGHDVRTAAGSFGTSPVAINDLGQIVGDYNDASRVQHGFLRAACGGITTFDPLTDVNGNDHGFFREPNGSETGTY